MAFYIYIYIYFSARIECVRASVHDSPVFVRPCKWMVECLSAQSTHILRGPHLTVAPKLLKAILKALHCDFPFQISLLFATVMYGVAHCLAFVSDHFLFFVFFLLRFKYKSLGRVLILWMSTFLQLISTPATDPPTYAPSIVTLAIVTSPIKSKINKRYSSARQAAVKSASKHVIFLFFLFHIACCLIILIMHINHSCHQTTYIWWPSSGKVVMHYAFGKNAN